MIRRVSVTVPASSGNLGPGFDVLGLALDYRNELHVRVLDKKPGAPLIRIVGEGDGLNLGRALPTDEKNGIYRTMEWLFRRAKKECPKLDIVCVNRIPLARGLGSSSAAYLSALLAANRLLEDAFSREDILRFATELEGHPDNVAPALLGGIRASGVFEKKIVTAKLPTPRLKMVVAVPAFELATKKARQVLPKRVPMQDAVFNLSAVALMSEALGSRPELLKDLLNDKLHEPYRAPLIKGFHKVKEAALRAGAFGVILSGAGPTILAFARPSLSEQVATAMRSAFKKAGVECKTMKLEIDSKGAVVK